MRLLAEVHAGGDRSTLAEAHRLARARDCVAADSCATVVPATWELRLVCRSAAALRQAEACCALRGAAIRAMIHAPGPASGPRRRGFGERRGIEQTRHGRGSAHGHSFTPP